MGETMETAADFLCLGSKITAAMKLKDACFLEGLILKLKLQYLGHLMRRTDLFEKTLMLGKISGSRRKGCREWDGWMASPIQWTWVWASSRSWRWRGKPGVLQSMGLQKVGHVWWTELNLVVVSAGGVCSTLFLLFRSGSWVFALFVSCPEFAPTALVLLLLSC